MKPYPLTEADSLDLLMPGRIFGQTSKFSPYNDLNDYLMQQHP